MQFCYRQDPGPQVEGGITALSPLAAYAEPPGGSPSTKLVLQETHTLSLVALYAPTSDYATARRSETLAKNGKLN